MPTRALVFSLLVLLIASQGFAFEQASPFDVGDRSQLFIDKVLVRDTERVAFTLHPARKHPANPLLKADKPWEGWRVELYGNVIYDEQEKIYKMWYLGEETETFPAYAAYYATSKDGIQWEKPLVGTAKAPKYPKHNVVAPGVILPSVMKDCEDPDPKRRYKMIGWNQNVHQAHTWVSPDGLNWTLNSEKAVWSSADVITGYYDKRLGKYVAFIKINRVVRGHERRVFWVMTSEDFETWTEPRLIISADLRDDASSLARIEQVRPMLDRPDDPKLVRTEFYGVGAYPAESCTVAFPWIFTVNNEARYGNQEGPGEVQLAVSRDLVEWERPFRTPCIPVGAVGEWDSGFFCTQSCALRVGDEIWLYYGGANYTHGNPCLYRAENTGRKTEFTGSVGLAIWDYDRFVSADAFSEGGSLTTVPVVFDGNALKVNANVKGSLTVSLLDAAGKPIPGFEASDVTKGDNLRHAITWNGKADVSALVGKPVVLRFDMTSAELFAFAFRTAE